MSTEPVRVALLARPGPAHDRLRGAVEEAGAECVFDEDPTTAGADALAATRPQLVLVALDPQVEDVLERFDALLFDPSVDVIYEEAELAAGREGWDVARWQRHLVAKLQRHRDVLPPGREPDEEAGESGEAAASDTFSPDAPPAPGATATHEATPAAEAEAATGATPAGSADTNLFDPVLAEDDGGESGVPAGTGPEGGAGDEDLPSFEWSLDPGPQEAALPVGGSGATGVPEGDDIRLDERDISHAPAQPSDDAASKGRFELDLQLLESRISGLELVHDDPPGRGPVGGVVVLAGIGGPDAVRQFLGALPAELPRPVLVHQQLDGARYDKLVAQMRRVSTLPVELGEPGQALAPGVVHVVPPDLGLEPGPDGYRFKAGADLIGVLPAADSAVVLLSGSDPALVDGLMKQRLAGALVLGQVAEGCYDPAASQALGSRGGETDTPVNLAARIAARWPVEGDPA